MTFYTFDQNVSNILTVKPPEQRLLESIESLKNEKPDPEKSFGKLFIDALSEVNELQMKPHELTEKMITEPDSIDIHDITMALAEAQLSLSMTKAIVEGAIRAYKEIISIR